MSSARSLLARLGSLVPAALLAGCLSPHYTVSGDELARLAQATESERATVRARQRLVFSARPEDAEPSTMLRDALTTAEDAVRVAATAQAAAKRLDELVGTGPSRAEAKPEAPRDPAQEEQAKKDKKSDATTAIIVVAVVAGSVFAGLVLAGSEGDRYDGALALPPAQPLHLRKANGEEIGWARARDLRPGMLTGVATGIVTEDDGPLTRLGRSPLDRKGFAYQVEVGAAGMNTLSRDLSVGFAGRTAVGWFPAQAFGLLAGFAVQTGSKGAQEVASEVRPLLEAQLLPLKLARIHPGLYVEGGYLFGSERTAPGESRSTGSWALGGGLLTQVDLSTFLALFGRVGALALPSPGPLAVSPTVSLGIAIY